MLRGVVQKTNKATTEISIGDDIISTLTRNLKVKKGDDATLSIRSELVKIARSKGPKLKHSLDATYSESVYLGLTTTHLFKLGTGETMMVRTIADSDERALKAGEKVRLTNEQVCWHVRSSRQTWRVRFPTLPCQWKKHLTCTPKFPDVALPVAFTSLSRVTCCLGRPSGEARTPPS